jgi:hypothetical protein
VRTQWRGQGEREQGRGDWNRTSAGTPARPAPAGAPIGGGATCFLNLMSTTLLILASSANPRSYGNHAIDQLLKLYKFDRDKSCNKSLSCVLLAQAKGPTEGRRILTVLLVLLIRLRSIPLRSRRLHAQPVRPHVLRGRRGVLGDERSQHSRQGTVRDDRGPLLSR